MAGEVVMFPADNEAEWEGGNDADHQAVFDTDSEFARLLEARGGAVTGGGGLAHSSQARTHQTRADVGRAGDARPLRGVR